MKIWVPGATGMLGSHVIRLLKERNHDVLGKEFGRVDVTNREAILDFISSNDVTHVINCSAYTQVDKAESEAEKAYETNVLGPLHLGHAAKKWGIKVIHFSTDYVFDGQGTNPYEESHPCSPINVYGSTKWEGEKQLLEQAPDSCVIRTSWLFGLEGKNFVHTMLRLMEEKETLGIVSDQIGRPTFCQDLAEVSLQLLDHRGIFHFANSNQTSWYHFATEIYHSARALSFPLKVKTLNPITTTDYPTPAKRPAYSSLSTEKIENLLGYKPRPWQEALRDYIRQYQQQSYYKKL